MKVIKYIALLICGLNSIVFADQKVESKLFLIDKIEAIIFGDESTDIITKSDIEKMTLDGKPRTLPDTIFERLLFMEANKFRVGADSDAVDRYLAMIMRENNMSQNDLLAMFRAAGYTYDEGREQLSIMFAANTVLDFKVKSRLVVPESQIVDYYNEHPITEEESYRLQRIFIPATEDVSVQEIKDKIDRSLRLGKSISGAQQSSAFWIKKSELASDKKYVTTMKVGTLSTPKKVVDGFEVYKLLEKREQCVVPLEDRYQEISNDLKRPLFEKTFEEYRKSLFDVASIVYY